MSQTDLFPDVKSRVRIVDLIQDLTGQQARRMGSCYSLPKCPFCGSDSGFRMWEETGSWKCFSTKCERGGDAFTFVQEQRQVTPIDSLKFLADRVGYALPDLNGEMKKSEERVRSEAIFRAAALHYHKKLMVDEKARKILRDTRGYDDATLTRFGLGYTGNAANGLLKALGEQFSVEELTAAGLVKARNGKPGDYFIPKLFVFPHLRGKTVGDFTIKDAFKHTKKGEDVIDYRLAKDYRLAGFHKVFNQDAVFFEEVYLCEGQHDAIQIMRATGKKNALAVTGTMGKDDWAWLAKRLEGKLVYCAFDRDEAGDAYVRHVFDYLWGKARIQVLSWEGVKAKDIDELLRTMPNAAKTLEDLKNESTEILPYLLALIPDVNDLSRATDAMEPFTRAIIANPDARTTDIALMEVQRRFAEKPEVAKMVSSQVKAGRVDKGITRDSETSPYYRADGQYFKRTANGPYHLSNFVLSIDEKYLLEEEHVYSCTLTNINGDVATEILFTARERADVNRFRARCMSKGSFHFNGNNRDLSGMWILEEEVCEPRRIRIFQRYGWIEDAGFWLFDNCVIKGSTIYPKDEEGYINVDGINYKSEGVRVYGNRVPSINVETPYSREWMSEIVRAFHHTVDGIGDQGDTDGYLAYMMLAFLPMTLYVDVLSHDKGGGETFVPHLFVYGKKGTGKSASLHMMMKMFGLNVSAESFSDATPDGTFKFVEYMSCLPAYYSEFSQNRLNKIGDLAEVIKNIYDRVGSGKGDVTGRQVRLPNGAMWFDGNDLPTNSIILDRIILLSMFNDINETRRKGMRFLQANSPQLSVMARNIITQKTPERAAKFLEHKARYVKWMMDENGTENDRLAGNYACVLAALDLLDIDLPPDLHDWIKNHALKTKADNADTDPVAEFFEHLGYLTTRGDAAGQFAVVEDILSFEDSFGHSYEAPILYIQVQSLLREMQEDNRRKGKYMTHGQRYYVDTLKNTNGFIEHQIQKKIGGRNQRCFVFSVNRMDKDIQEIINPYLSSLQPAIGDS